MVSASRGLITIRPPLLLEGHTLTDLDTLFDRHQHPIMVPLEDDTDNYNKGGVNRSISTTHAYEVVSVCLPRRQHRSEPSLIVVERGLNLMDDKEKLLQRGQNFASRSYPRKLPAGIDDRAEQRRRLLRPVGISGDNAQRVQDPQAG
ncbi:hypothetical protein ON010_g17504 [Phytophthora cinnamomi]|nr:hypothetical protein ON010_g17504 [Phytophthora cinnamomi]